MSRELKFRAWDTSSESPKMRELTPSVGFSSVWLVSDYETAVMQFTGLKDKTGKEIYEGDILTNRINCSGEVYYASGGYKCRMFYDNGQEIAFDLINVAEVTTIAGNVYENPELTPSTKKHD